jgi:hypothetical protein
MFLKKNKYLKLLLASIIGFSSMVNASSYEFRAYVNGMTTGKSHTYNDEQVFMSPIENYSAYVGASGDGRSLVDGGFSYGAFTPSSGIYNSSTGPAWASGVLNVSENAYVTKLKYFYSSDATNYQKKIKYIDLYSWNGSGYTLYTTLTTSAPILNGSSTEILTLPNPMKLDDTHRVKIVVRSNWGGYYNWVSEIYFYVSSDGNL